MRLFKERVHNKNQKTQFPPPKGLDPLMFEIFKLHQAFDLLITRYQDNNYEDDIDEENNNSLVPDYFQLV